jgi:hypothetical protein
MTDIFERLREALADRYRIELDRLTAALADRYAIERELGAGGMATVYLAGDHNQRQLGNSVA